MSVDPNNNHAKFSVSRELQAMKDVILEACPVPRLKNPTLSHVFLVLTVQHQTVHSTSQCFSEWLGNASALNSVSCYSPLRWTHHWFYLYYCTSSLPNKSSSLTQEIITHRNFLKKTYYFYLCVCICAYVWGGVECVCVVHAEARSRYQIPWSQTYRRLWAA